MSLCERTSLSDLEPLGRLVKYQPFDIDRTQCSQWAGSLSIFKFLLSLLINTFSPDACIGQILVVSQVIVLTNRA